MKRKSLCHTGKSRRRSMNHLAPRWQNMSRTICNLLRLLPASNANSWYSLPVVNRMQRYGAGAPVPPDESLLQPLAYAASAYRMTIIAGLPVEHNLPVSQRHCHFRPWVTSPLIFHQSHGACVARHRKTISVMDEQPEGIDIDPAFSLFTTSQCVSEHDLFTSTSRLQRFRIASPLPC